MRFEYWQTADGAWDWHLKSSVGEIIARGTPMTTREQCLSAIKLVKLAASASCRDVSTSEYACTPLASFSSQPA